MAFKTDFEKFALSKGIGSGKLDAYQKYMGYINPYVLEESNMNLTSFPVFSRLMIDRIIFLGSEIDDEIANIIVAQLLWLEQQGEGDINMYINSPGGSIYAGYSLLDTMNLIKPEICTVSMGMVASMATIIASSGTKGKRHILPHARFLVHQPLSGISPHTQCSDIQIHAREVEKLKVELTQILCDNSGQDYETMEKMCDRDTILTAKEAVEYGFMDKIVIK